MQVRICPYNPGPSWTRPIPPATSKAGSTSVGNLPELSRQAVTVSRTASCCRRRTSPARCTWAMPSSTRSWTRSRAGIACAAARHCGSRAPITPASPRKWWWSASLQPRANIASTWAAKNSSSGSGPGRPSPAAPSRGRCDASVPRWTGHATSSRWIPSCRAPSPKCSCGCTTKDSSTAASAW
jgi:hypothetical protein